MKRRIEEEDDDADEPKNARKGGNFVAVHEEEWENERGRENIEKDVDSRWRQSRFA